MLSKKEFKKEFIKVMVEKSSLDILKDQEFVAGCANEYWEVYQDDSTEMVPAVCVETEMRDWE